MEQDDSGEHERRQMSCGMTAAVNDTSAQASDVYYRRLSEMTPGERVRIGLALWAAGDSLQRAAIRREYPDADEAEITFRLAAARFGEERARRMYQRS